MQYRQLGKSGLLVSELCFGAMTFGGQGFWKVIGELEYQSAKRLIDISLEGGINFFDTADVYSYGMAEDMLGRALGEKRKDVILATKVRGRMSAEINDVGLSRHHILNSCNNSLRRLGTDWIDLYIVHSFDFITPLEETLRALDDLVRVGKVRYLGVSNFAAWQLMKALAISEQHNLEKFVSLQAYYSLVSRDVETELVPLCMDQGLGITPWSPLAGGFLTGKYQRGERGPQGARRAKEEQNFIPIDYDKGFPIVDELRRIAESHKATPAQAALNYLLRKPGVSSVIIGANKTEQLEDNLKAVEWTMTDEEVARLDDLSKPYRPYPHWMHDIVRHDRTVPRMRGE
ncbi:MAG TPA: aldo/keto reductase [bacterium]|jgi:aryl-alcohol dehydrogenase-like predicted oxidoreductase